MLSIVVSTFKSWCFQLLSIAVNSGSGPIAILTIFPELPSHNHTHRQQLSVSAIVGGQLRKACKDRLPCAHPIESVGSIRFWSTLPADWTESGHMTCVLVSWEVLKYHIVALHTLQTDKLSADLRPLNSCTNALCIKAFTNLHRRENRPLNRLITTNGVRSTQVSRDICLPVCRTSKLNSCFPTSIQEFYECSFITYFFSRFYVDLL